MDYSSNRVGGWCGLVSDSDYRCRNRCARAHDSQSKRISWETEVMNFDFS
jgi:hypothetical protein